MIVITECVKRMITMKPTVNVLMVGQVLHVLIAQEESGENIDSFGRFLAIPIEKPKVT